MYLRSFRVSLEVCDLMFCSGPARILVQVEGINDNAPVIAIRPAEIVCTILLQCRDNFLVTDF